MSLRPLQIWRFILTAVAVLSTLVLSTAAVSPDHGHRGLSAHECVVCQAGHLPLETPSALPQILPGGEPGDPIFTHFRSYTPDFFAGVSSSRGPPPVLSLLWS